MATVRLSPAFLDAKAAVAEALTGATAPTSPGRRPSSAAFAKFATAAVVPS